MDILGQKVHALRIVVATHEGDTGDIITVFIHEGIDSIGVKGEAYVLPEVMAMTPRTVTRAITDVNCQCHFVGYLLKYYACIDVLQHGFRLVCQGVITAGGLFLTGLREVGNALQIADDTRHVIDILRMAVGALLQIALVDMAAVVADGVGDVEGEVVTTFLGSHLQQLHVLILREVLDKEALDRLIDEYQTGITCVCFMGGDAEPYDVANLAMHVKNKYKSIKTAWYSGRNELPKAFHAETFDYIKTGRYEEKLGALDSITTNQRMVKRLADGRMKDITNRFQKQTEKTRLL